MSRRPYAKSASQSRRKASAGHKSRAQKSNQLAKNAPAIELTISHIGGRGDGVGTADYTHNYQTKSHHVFVPDTLPGEVVLVQPSSLNGQGISAKLSELISPSPQRKEPDCSASPACGGCQFQHMAQEFYRAWKSENVKSVLAKSDITPAQWYDDYFAKPYQRRRARLAFRRRKDDVLIGFRERGSHHIIYPQDCTMLDSELMNLVDGLRDNLLLGLHSGMTGEVELTLCDNGCDVTLHPDETSSGTSWPADIITTMTVAAGALPIARLSLMEKAAQNAPAQAALLYMKDAPFIKWQMPEGAAYKQVKITPAASAFLQADRAAEAVMQADIFRALQGANHILDLFSGSGTLSAPLLFQNPPPHKITAFDSVPEALAVYDHLADNHGLSMHLKTQMRHLFDAPLTQKELEAFDAAIIDPPRAGAITQMPAIAASQIAKVMMVSCNPHSFARDARILIDGGYECQWARHIDQFALTSHSEIVALFTKQILDGPQT